MASVEFQYFIDIPSHVVMEHIWHRDFFGYVRYTLTYSEENPGQTFEDCEQADIPSRIVREPEQPEQPRQMERYTLTYSEGTRPD